MNSNILGLNGKVESSNRFATWLIPYNHEFENEIHLISIIEQFNKDVNNTKHATFNIEPILLFNKEKNTLQLLPKKPIIDDYLNKRKHSQVTPESLVYYNGKGYSVDKQYINCYMDVECFDNILRIYYKDKLVEIFDITKYNDFVNYKEEEYIDILKSSFNNKSPNDVVEIRAKKNLENLNRIGGVIRELQQTTE